MIFKILLIGLGGFTGAILRFELNIFVINFSKNSPVPISTLTINLLGCLLIGALSQLVDSRGFFNGPLSEFIFVGFLGAFTTFSTFSNETYELLRSGKMFFAIENIGMHLILGLIAIWAGHFLVVKLS